MTKSELMAAAAPATNMTDFLTALALPLSPTTRAAMWARLGQCGIDTSHWNRSPRGGNKYDDEDLKRAVADSTSIAEVLRRLNIKQAGGSHFHGSPRAKRHQLVRAMTECGVEHVCSGCGIGPIWRGSALTLAVDHLNGDWLDNRLANLRFLCPNCHAQTSTWCRRKRSPSL
jgi:predicted RNA-binding Zn-ribbon protein involved in translation (DUF1610 family)